MFTVELISETVTYSHLHVSVMKQWNRPDDGSFVTESTLFFVQETYWYLLIFKIIYICLNELLFGINFIWKVLTENSALAAKILITFD